MVKWQSALLGWYAKNKRDLPWRKSQDPYAILVSEIMLQQTQVKTVIPYYQRWMSRFPTWRALARANTNHVLKAWEGLGYYARARRLHALAKHLIKKCGGKLPSTYDALIRLPGIGRYTAGAVLSIAFHKDFPVLDGNVMRVLARLYAIRKDISLPAVQKELWRLCESLLPKGRAGDFNQALMELGATVCLPKGPACGRCPLRWSCAAFHDQTQEQLPLKRKSARVPHHDIGAGVIWRHGKILISQRPLRGLLGGLWEFPGGKRESGEALPATVAREIKEELGINVAVGQKLATVRHAYSHLRITLHAHECQYRSGKVRALGVHAWRWVRPAELKQFAFPAANQPVIALLLQHRPADLVKWRP